MKLEEILFGLIGTGGCWVISINMKSAEGTIYIKSGVIVRVEYKNSYSEQEGESALKTIIKNSEEVRSVDLEPCKKPVEKNLNCNFSSLMSFFELYKVEKEAESAILEIETNIQEVYDELILDGERFKSALELCSKIFSKNFFYGIFLFDKDGILKIEGSMLRVDVNFKIPYELFIAGIKDNCEGSGFVDFLLNLTSKFAYGVYNLEKENALVVVFDIKDKANFELDQDMIRKSLKETLEKL